MLQAGLRISEVANLELNDITENTIIVRAYESHPQRVVPLNRAAKEAVRRYIENDRPKQSHQKNFCYQNWPAAFGAQHQKQS